MDLTSLGWDAGFDEAFARFRAEGLFPGRVALEDKHTYTVLAEAGEYSTQVPGRMLHQTASRAELPKVGDWVAVRSSGEAGRGVLEGVLPRRTRLSRKRVGRERTEQVLVANIDTAFVVQALDASFNLRRLERFLVMVHEGGARAVVILNKTDLAKDLDVRLAEVRQTSGQTPVVAASALTGRGIGSLREHIPSGQTAVFIGPSGVGKSSLINRLYGDEIQATIEVRECDAKGRHTTTWRELIVLPKGGLVIDTPGMREFHMWLADEGLEEAFPDVEEFGVRCHFRGCSHTVEKRCAVLEALADGRLARDRYDHYLKLKRELDYLAEERQRHTYQTRRERSRGGGRPHGNGRQTEPADSW